MKKTPTPQHHWVDLKKNNLLFLTASWQGFGGLQIYFILIWRKKINFLKIDILFVKMHKLGNKINRNIAIWRIKSTLIKIIENVSLLASLALSKCKNHDKQFLSYFSHVIKLCDVIIYWRPEAAKMRWFFDHIWGLKKSRFEYAITWKGNNNEFYSVEQCYNKLVCVGWAR